MLRLLCSRSLAWPGLIPVTLAALFAEPFLLIQDLRFSFVPMFLRFGFFAVELFELSPLDAT